MTKGDRSSTDEMPSCSSGRDNSSSETRLPDLKVPDNNHIDMTEEGEDNDHDVTLPSNSNGMTTESSESTSVPEDEPQSSCNNASEKTDKNIRNGDYAYLRRSRFTFELDYVPCKPFSSFTDWLDEEGLRRLQTFHRMFYISIKDLLEEEGKDNDQYTNLHETLGWVSEKERNRKRSKEESQLQSPTDQENRRNRRVNVLQKRLALRSSLRMNESSEHVFTPTNDGHVEHCDGMKKMKVHTTTNKTNRGDILRQLTSDTLGSKSLNKRDFKEGQQREKERENKENVLNSMGLNMRTHKISSYYRNASVYMLPNNVPWQNFDDRRERELSFLNAPAQVRRSAPELAESGFVYMGEGGSDRVKCFYCEAQIEYWTAANNVDHVHSLMSPTCPRLLVLTSNNEATGPQNPFAQQGVDASAANIETNFQGLAVAENNEGNAPSSSLAISNGGASEMDYMSAGATYNFSDSQPSAMDYYEARPSAEVTTSDMMSDESHNMDDANVDDYRSTPIPTPTAESLELPTSFEEEPRVTPLPAMLRNAISITSHAATSTSTSSQTASQGGARPRGNASSASRQNGTHEQANSRTTDESTRNNQMPGTNAPDANTLQRPELSCRDLGIFAERPRHSNLATIVSRMDTFEGWTDTGDKPTADQLARSGLYFGGYGDCTRCFYCGGSMRNWTPEDDVFVEHARWFPMCAYIRQYMGHEFVDTVQELVNENPDTDQFTYEMVMDRLRSSGRQIYYDDDLNLDEDAAVMSLLAEGCNREEVIKAAKEVIKDGEILSADLILRKVRQHKQAQLDQRDGASARAVGSDTVDGKEIENLKEENYTIRRNLLCKICLDREVRIVFLPCGHLVCCRECATALVDCPVCRTFIRGTVRASMPSQPNKE